METNLAHEPPKYQGEVVQFPKYERQVMSKKDGGFTPLPNFICDEGYLAVLSGEAIKCLVLLNRHVNGFHAENRSIGEALVMKITGFKDKRTVRKSMAELAKYKLITITKTLGKATTYAVHFENRTTLELVTVNDTGALNVTSASHVTGVVTSNVTTTSDIKCHSVKQIDLKENIKEKICVQDTHDQATQDQILAEQKAELEHLEKAKAKSQLNEQIKKNFELFWSAYPNKKSKKTAHDKFTRIDFKKHSFESIMTSLEKQKLSEDWTKNGGQYVPMPQTWIFNERWTDEVQAPAQQHTDVNAYWDVQLRTEKRDASFVATLVLGEEFN